MDVSRKDNNVKIDGAPGYEERPDIQERQNAEIDGAPGYGYEERPDMKSARIWMSKEGQNAKIDGAPGYEERPGIIKSRPRMPVIKGPPGYDYLICPKKKRRFRG